MPLPRKLSSFKELAIKLLDQVRWLHCHEYIRQPQSADETTEHVSRFGNDHPLLSDAVDIRRLQVLESTFHKDCVSSHELIRH